MTRQVEKICALPGCEEPVPTGQRRFCCVAHQRKFWNLATVKNGIGLTAAQNKPSRRGRYLSDTEQQKINKEIDDKYAIPLNRGRTIKRGSAEFARLAAYYTALEAQRA